MPKERPARNAFDALVVLAVLIASVWVIPAGLTGRPWAIALPSRSSTSAAASSTSTAPATASTKKGSGVTPVSTPAPNRPHGPVVAVTDLGGFDEGIAFGAGSLWAASGSRLLRIDPATNKVSAEIPIEPNGSGAAGVAFGAGAVWVPVAMPAALWRIDPAKNRVVAKIPLGTNLDGTVSVSATDGAVWLASEDHSGSRAAGLLTHVDPAHNRVAGRVRVAGVPTSIAATSRAVWAATVSDGIVVIDARKNQVVKTLALASSLGYAQTVVAAAGAVWLADPFDQQVLRLDPASMNVVARIPAGAVTGLAADSAGVVWAATPDGILRIDPRHRQVTVSSAVPVADLDDVLLLTSGGNALWAGRTASVAHLDPKRIQP